YHFPLFSLVIEFRDVRRGERRLEDANAMEPAYRADDPALLVEDRRGGGTGPYGFARDLVPDHDRLIDDRLSFESPREDTVRPVEQGDTVFPIETGRLGPARDIRIPHQVADMLARE